MSNLPDFSFCAQISGACVKGKIVRRDGETVTLTELEVPDLMVDLGTGGLSLPERPKHYSRVLGEWFARKTAVVAIRAAS